VKLIGVIMANYSFSFAIALPSSLYLIDVVATIALIPERKGTALT